MSTVTTQTLDRPVRLVHHQVVPSMALPPFEFGDRLSRAEFHRRYEAHPEIKKAELI